MSLHSESSRERRAEQDHTARADDQPAAAEGQGDPDESRSLASDLDEVQRAKPERAFNVGVALGILVSVAAAVFVVQNSRSTSFDWLWFDFRMPMWTALLGAVLVGVMVLGVVLAVHHRRQRRIERREEAGARLRRQLFRWRRARPVTT